MKADLQRGRTNPRARTSEDFNIPVRNQPERLESKTFAEREAAYNLEFLTVETYASNFATVVSRVFGIKGKDALNFVTVTFLVVASATAGAWFWHALTSSSINDKNQAYIEQLQKSLADLEAEKVTLASNLTQACSNFQSANSRIVSLRNSCSTTQNGDNKLCASVLKLDISASSKVCANLP